MGNWAPPMTSPTRRFTLVSPRFRSSRGFTLIELILVMVIMAVGAALVVPHLTSFFRGQIVDQEARRMLSLTQYARSRAVAEGLPMEFWLNQDDGRYGVNILTGFAAGDDRALSYAVDPDVYFSFEARANDDVYEVTDPIETASDTLIVFLPDGLIQTGSILRIHLSLTGENPSLALNLDRLGTGYELLPSDELAFQ